MLEYAGGSSTTSGTAGRTGSLGPASSCWMMMLAGAKAGPAGDLRGRFGTSIAACEANDWCETDPPEEGSEPGCRELRLSNELEPAEVGASEVTV